MSGYLSSPTVGCGSPQRVKNGITCAFFESGSSCSPKISIMSSNADSHLCKPEMSRRAFSADDPSFSPL